MSSRDRILKSVSLNQPAESILPENPTFSLSNGDPVEQFVNVAVQIGSRVFEASDMEEVNSILKSEYATAKRIISALPESEHFVNRELLSSFEPHSFENIDLLLISGQFGVAENGAIWVTDENLAQRVLPFITQHLAIVIDKKNIVANMHQAYERIGNAAYDYAAFIAGPSKTADIEQSLVLGAHGPRGLSIFLL